MDKIILVLLKERAVFWCIKAFQNGHLGNLLEVA